MNLAGVVPWTLVARAHRAGAARGRQLLLHGLSVHAAARARPPARPGRRAPGRARCARKWLAVALLAALLRRAGALRLVGRPARHRRCWCSPTSSPRSPSTRWCAAPASASTSARSASSSSSSSLVSPLEVKVRLPVVCAELRHEGLPARQRARSAAASSTSICRARWATSTARSASTACRPARTTTSVSSPSCPASRLVADRRGASIGRWSRRPDVAALALVVVLAAFAVAGGDGDPDRARARPSRSALVVAARRCWPRLRVGRGGALFCRLSLALVPLGVGHVGRAPARSTSSPAGGRSWPVVQRALGLAQPDWSLACRGRRARPARHRRAPAARRRAPSLAVPRLAHRREARSPFAVRRLRARRCGPLAGRRVDSAAADADARDTLLMRWAPWLVAAPACSSPRAATPTEERCASRRPQGPFVVSVFTAPEPLRVGTRRRQRAGATSRGERRAARRHRRAARSRP